MGLSRKHALAVVGSHKEEVDGLREINAELLTALKELRNADPDARPIAYSWALKRADDAIAKAKGGE